MGLSTSAVIQLVKHKCGLLRNSGAVSRKRIQLQNVNGLWINEKNDWNLFEVGKYIVRLNPTIAVESLITFGPEEERIWDSAASFDRYLFQASTLIS